VLILLHLGHDVIHNLGIFFLKLGLQQKSCHLFLLPDWIHIKQSRSLSSEKTYLTIWKLAQVFQILHAFSMI